MLSGIRARSIAPSVGLPWAGGHEHEVEAYRAVREKARSLAGAAADEDLFLSVPNLADTVLRLLVAATGIEMEGWLSRLHEDYIEPIEPEGTGVWWPRDLQV